MEVGTKASIARVRAPSMEEFVAESEAFTKPLIILGVIDSWKATSVWNLSYFKSKLGQLPVIVSSSSDGTFRGDPESGYSKMRTRVSFNKFMELTAPGQKNAHRYYLAQNDIDNGAFSILAGDLETPPYIESKAKIIRNVWIGPADIVTPLHFDVQHNFFAQISGQKRFVLFPPDQSKYLYPFPRNSKLPNLAQVDIEKPDPIQHPEFLKAERTEEVVETGELLFLPPNWWHQVYSVTASISVNFWWEQ